MLYPTIDELTKGNQFNRYELALATAKCARLITDEYVRQHDVAEKSQTGNKETDKPINTMIDRELRDEKAVKVAIGRLHRGEYEIDLEAGNAPAQIIAEEIEPETVVDVEAMTADEQDDAADEALQDSDEAAE
jgi:DNA-directed RNA polymerase subunit K/omega